MRRAWLSASVVASHARGPGYESRSESFFSVLLATKKREDNLKLVPNLSYSINLVKIRVVIGVFRHTESKSSLYFVLSPFLKEVLVIPCGTLVSCSRFLKHVLFFVET